MSNIYGYTTESVFAKFVSIDKTQTISGKKTFATLPESPELPTTSNQLTNKAFVDSSISTAIAAGSFVTTNTAQSITALKTFTVLPESSVAPTTNNQLTNKAFVDSSISTALSGSFVTTNTAQSITAVKTFTVLPESSVAPTTNNQLTNKTYVDGVANAITTVAVANNDSATTFYPVFTSTGAGQKALLFDITTTPLSYQPSTGTLSSTYFSLPTTNASTITGSGANIDITNNNIGGIINYTVATSTIPLTIISMSETNTFFRAPISIIKPMSFTSALDTERQINNTFYNLHDTTAVASGAAQARIYSNQTTTYIEGYVGNHNIVGTENSTISGRQLFNFGSSSADLYPLNIRLGSSSAFNIGSGAGTISNLVIGSSTPKTIAFTTGANTFVGTSAGQSATIASANNTCFGNSSGLGLTSGIQNTFIGNLAGFQTANGAGNDNVCVGFQSGTSMTTTSKESTIIGTNAGKGLTNAIENTIIGHNSGIGTTSGSSNVFVGAKSGFQTIANPGVSGANVCIGISSGAGMTTTANNNTFVGSRAGDIVTSGLYNICIGADSEPLTATTSNSITIGTAAETMFIQGGFNYRIGTNITTTATGTLTAPLAQFYSVAMAAASQTITLPAPNGANVKGACVTFKRKTNTTAFTIGAGLSSMMPVNLVAAANTISIGSTTYNVELVCDGIYWSVVQQS